MKHYFERLKDSIKAYWNSPALGNYGGETFSFGEVATQVEKLHLFFSQINIQKGDKIALCAKNTARWGMSFLAGNTYEAVMVPILADFHPDSIKSLVTHSESVILFTDNELWTKLNAADMPTIKVVISTTDFTLLYSVSKEIEEIYRNTDSTFLSKYPNGFSKEFVNYPINNDKELAIINYTSGTTSNPKGVMLRYECISANVEFGQSRIPSGPNDKIVSMLPMAHMYGLMFELIYPLCGGTSIYYISRMPTPAILMGALGEIKPYLLITVPLVMEKIFRNKLQPVLQKPAIKILTSIPGVNLLLFKKIRNTLLEAFGGNIREIVMGGAALNPDVEKWLKKIGIPYTVGYGMTEAAPLMAYEGWQKFVPKSCGKAIDFVKVRIDSEDPYKIVGEIQAKGVNIMSGYYKNQEATKAAFTEDGWMNTGDLGLLDKEGNIFIKGRSKNMILTPNGQNIYPEEVESVINNQPYMVESIVVSRGAALIALVYFDPDKIAQTGINMEQYSKTLMKEVNEQMPAYSKLSAIEIVDTPFEKTPKMSIKRFLYN